MKKTKTEIISVIKGTNHVQNAQGDGKSKAVYEIKYRVRIHNAMSMDAEEIVLAEDELDAYRIAKQIIKDKQSHGGF